MLFGQVFFNRSATRSCYQLPALPHVNRVLERGARRLLSRYEEIIDNRQSNQR